MYHALARLGLMLAIFSLDAVVADCSVIQVLAMNADTSSDLEGTLAGSGIDGSSLFTIAAVPITSASNTTFADYSISGVDINNDSLFNESFDFRLTFSSPNQINFSSTREVMGLGGNETLDSGESWTMSVTVLSDSSATHNVTFDGIQSMDFVSMSGSNLEIASVSGASTVTLVGSDTSLGGLFDDPTFTYSTASGNTSNTGTLEDWSVQFSSAAVAVPEPSSIAVLSLVGLGIAGSRRRT